MRWKKLQGEEPCSYFADFSDSEAERECSEGCEGTICRVGSTSSGEVSDSGMEVNLANEILIVRYKIHENFTRFLEVK